MMTSICLRVIEGRPRRSRSFVFSLIFAPNRHGNFQQISIEFQPSGLSSLQIDFESNRLVLKQEIDDSTLIEELVALANGQDGEARQLLNRISQPPFLRRHEEQNVAAAEI